MDLSGAAVMVLLVVIILGILFFLYFIPVGLWITAYFSGVPVSLFTAGCHPADDQRHQSRPQPGD
jgi:uncharacterized protein YqfA (UPF0365 family)